MGKMASISRLFFGDWSHKLLLLYLLVGGARRDGVLDNDRTVSWTGVWKTKGRKRSRVVSVNTVAAV